LATTLEYFVYAVLRNGLLTLKAFYHSSDTIHIWPGMKLFKNELANCKFFEIIPYSIPS